MNWQPQTDRLSVTLQDGYCVLTASRSKPAEVVRRVTIEPQVAQVLELVEEAGFVLAGSEVDMQQTIARHPELIEPGLRILDRELLSGVGDMDLYAQDQRGRSVMMDLKRAKATQQAVHQLCRYVDAVRVQGPGEVRGILAAPGISQPAAMTQQQAGLEFGEVQALPEAPVAALPPSLFR